VEKRLAGAWSVRDVEPVLAAHGLAREEGDDDPFYRVLRARGEIDLEVLRSALAPLRTAAFRGVVPGTLVIVPSADPIDAIVAVGVAGPRDGVGTRAVVRFAIHLRSFATVTIDEIGESKLGMRVVPRDPGAAARIAERVRQICPSLPWTAAELAACMLETGRLDLAWR
jgi:hypothetical protein